ncbi:MAG: potassium transporter Kef, partial [Nanohaloarchaea archaeon SW_10_44_10]
MNAGFEALALIIGLATVLSFIAKKTGQPTVISYILTGLILGPVGIGLLGQTETTQLFSELGLVFLLFFIGLEINISKIREVLEPTVLIGIAQMVLSAALGFATGFLLGFTVIESVFFGAAAMFSSTALVVKILTDKDEASTLPGRLDIGILLIQDIVVVLILAILTANFNSITGTLFRFGEILVMIGLVGGISLASSKYLLPKVFKKTSIDKHAFFIYGIAWAFILISGAQHLDLSLEIGAFFAGLSLAQLPYSSELQEKVRPLTDLFMALFFINFGLQILPEQLSAYFVEAVLASAVLMIGKFGIFFGLTDHMKFTPQTSFKTSINMTQISEFSLILGALAASEQLIGQNFLGFISLVAIITMSSSSYLLNFNEKIYREVEGLVKNITTDEGEDVEIERMDNHAIILGYNRVTERL